MKKIILFPGLVLFALLVAGCFHTSTPSTQPTSSSSTEETVVDKVAETLSFASYQFTTKDEMEDVARMKTKDAIVKSTKFKITAGESRLSVSVLELNDATKRDAVKAEIEAQWADLKKFAPDIQTEWLEKAGNATALVALTYKDGDEFDAGLIMGLFDED